MSTTVDQGAREAMTGYWNRYSDEATIKNMMLDKDADKLNKHEKPEILSYLPSFDNKDVVELGAGIGRFTSEFAVKAKSVIAVDFVDNFIAENRKNNSQFTNIDFKCADVTQLALTENSCDLVFTNWLLMYLEDPEVQDLVTRSLSWLHEGGYLFIRESCFVAAAGGRASPARPTKYRDPAEYTDIFTKAKLMNGDEDTFGYDLIMSRPLSSYVEIKQNAHQIIWLLQKVKLLD